MTRAFVGLGSNLGDRVGSLAKALGLLGRVPGVRIAAVSRAYESEPWGVVDQPAFANAVAVLDVSVEAEELLAACKRIERELGRQTGERFGPRPIDLDVLLFGDRVIDGPGLTIPHPRMLERDFVVTPLLEVAPGLRMPAGSAVERHDGLEGRVTGVIGVLPGFEELTGGA